MSDDFRIAPMDVEPDEDHTEDIGDKAHVLHHHYCMWCDQHWQHHVGDEACVEAPHLDCPKHEGERQRLR